MLSRCSTWQFFVFGAGSVGSMALMVICILVRTARCLNDPVTQLRIRCAASDLGSHLAVQSQGVARCRRCHR